MIPKPFKAVVRDTQLQGWDQGHETLNISRTGFFQLVRQLIADVSVDEDFYLATYPDVAEGIRNGIVADAQDHYIRFGYVEGRLPHLEGFDPLRYREAYPDLTGREPSMTAEELVQHFVHHGHREGRVIS